VIVTGATKVAGVIGDPVAHSLSPAIHNAAFRAGGLNWVLCAFLVEAIDPETDGASILEAMALLNIGGLAVTTPHKGSVAAALMRRDPTGIDPAARALNSVNTLSRDDAGRIRGASTDGEGFVASLRAAEVDLDRKVVALLGAGAAARSVVDALERTEVADILVINRTDSGARAAAALSARAKVAKIEDLLSADLVINATSVGMGTDESPVASDFVRSGQVVADLVYHPLETRLLREARAKGAHGVDGLGMLIHQAALQQRLWTGMEPDISAMRTAAETELAARRR
jgi:shikimate dehydrogenase